MGHRSHVLRKVLRIDTQKIIRKKWNDFKMMILTLKCKFQKQKNTGVEVSFQYHALNASWLGNNFLFLPTPLEGDGPVNVFFAGICMNTVYLE